MQSQESSEGEGCVQSRQRFPGPRPVRVQLGLRGVLHVLRGRTSDLGLNLLNLSCSQNLGLEKLGCGTGLVGVP